MAILLNVLLVIHFSIMVFIIFMLITVPFGNILKLNFVYNRKIRFLHASLVAFILLETILGLSCPLTVIENILRQHLLTDSFMSNGLMKLIYWDLSISMFIWLYLFCFLWVIALWFIFPPTPDHVRQIRK